MQRDPGLEHERWAWERGYRLIVGIDEVGRGAWAGPVAAAAVVLPPEEGLLERLPTVRDSKLLSPAQRERCYRVILDVALDHGVGMVPAEEIDRVGIVPATRQAMTQAIAQLHVCPEYLLIDALQLALPIAQKRLIKGDRICLSIAAASIVAKVERDRWMAARDAEYPAFGFAHNKGYGTAQHRQALAQEGPTPLHRRSFAPLRLLTIEDHA
ncbi:MAG: ribonuclease HII [Anaerolineales bacterium]